MDNTLKEVIRDKYGTLARSAANSCCCSPAGCGCGVENYPAGELAGLPEGLLSLGCGNPTALASLQPGEVVLDLGSGAGLDVLLSARRVGPEGKAYGLDMTDDMLALARKNQQLSQVNNVEFLKGDIENIPLPSNHVDVVISNCVINLAADKGKVFREIYRVLKPNGRLAISDMVWRREVPSWLRKNVELWVGCVAGALTEQEYLRLLTEAGFTGVDVEVANSFSAADLTEDIVPVETLEQLAPYDGSLISAFIRGQKPLA